MSELKAQESMDPTLKILEAEVNSNNNNISCPENGCQNMAKAPHSTSTSVNFGSVSGSPRIIPSEDTSPRGSSASSGGKTVNFSGLNNAPIQTSRTGSVISPHSPHNGSFASKGARYDDSFDASSASRSSETENASFSSKSASPIGAAAKKQNNNIIFENMRKLVSKKKIRFQEDGYDLDLTYITPRIIAMGFPASGSERYFRNPCEEVEQFFEQRHENHYRVYNLCAERHYDSDLRFNQQWRRFPFDDHNAPCPINLIPDFVTDAAEFLAADDENIVAVHCKAGKGRTGVMIAALLMAIEPAMHRDAATALTFYAEGRTDNSKGVTIPSQIRYVHYYEKLLRNHRDGREPSPPSTVRLDAITFYTTFLKGKSPPDLYFILNVNNDIRLDSRHHSCLSGSKNWSNGAQSYTFNLKNNRAELQGPVYLRGDCKIQWFSKAMLLSDDALCHFWFNTTLCGNRVVLTKSEIDGANKKSKVCDDLKVVVELTTEQELKEETRKNRARGASGADGASKLTTPTGTSANPKTRPHSNSSSLRSGVKSGAIQESNTLDGVKTQDTLVLDKSRSTVALPNGTATKQQQQIKNKVVSDDRRNSTADKSKHVSLTNSNSNSQTASGEAYNPTQDDFDSL